jgi:hypothetical protein
MAEAKAYFNSSIVGDFSGRDKYLETGNVVAGNEQVFKAILKTIHVPISVFSKPRVLVVRILCSLR